MGSSNVIESEVVLFLLIDNLSAAALNARARMADAITQARTRSLTDSGQEITNRVRRSVLAGKDPVYTQCTKYLLPGNDMSQGHCVEIETEIDEAQYKAAIPFMSTMSVKFRHSVSCPPVRLEIDHMVPVGRTGGGEFIKVDIEGGTQDQVARYLEALARAGIKVLRNLTEEGKAKSENIGGKMMGGPDYNHAAQ